MNPRLRQALAWLLALMLMLMVLALYLQPGFMVTVAEQVWACF